MFLDPAQRALGDLYIYGMHIGTLAHQPTKPLIIRVIEIRVGAYRKDACACNLSILPLTAIL